MQKLIVMVVVLLSACTDDTVVPPVELGSASSCRVDEDCCAAFHPCSTTYVAVDRSQVRDANALADIANVGQGCSRCATTQPLPVCSDGTCQRTHRRCRLRPLVRRRRHRRARVCRPRISWQRSARQRRVRHLDVTDDVYLQLYAGLMVAPLTNLGLFEFIPHVLVGVGVHFD